MFCIHNLLLPVFLSFRYLCVGCYPALVLFEILAIYFRLFAVLVCEVLLLVIFYIVYPGFAFFYGHKSHLCISGVLDKGKDYQTSSCFRINKYFFGSFFAEWILCSA